MSDYYSKDEIIALFRKSKNKENQIQILAELTASDIETILEILRDAGVYEGIYKTCSICGRRYPVLREYRPRRQICSKCAQVEEEIKFKDLKIKKNMAKMAQLQRENVKLRQEISEMEKELLEKKVVSA